MRAHRRRSSPARRSSSTSSYSTSRRRPPPSPSNLAHMAEPSGIALLFATFTAYQRTEALKAAVELGVFTAIAEGNDTPATIAARCGDAERGVRILCDALTVAGLICKEGGRYALDPETAPLLD